MATSIIENNISKYIIMDYSNSFESLNAWKYAKELRIEIGKIVKKYPSFELTDLVSQTRRSVRSIGANIAEGHGRFHYLENIRFCRIARGSLMETINHLHVALEENYISISEFQQLKDKLLICNKLINGYISYLKNKRFENPENLSHDRKQINKA